MWRTQEPTSWPRQDGWPLTFIRSAVRPADLTANALAKVLHEPTPARLEWQCCPITTVDRWVASRREALRPFGHSCKPTDRSQEWLGGFRPKRYGVAVNTFTSRLNVSPRSGPIKVASTVH